MASKYPPGVTGNEPQIAGESHYRDCPLNEEWECSDEDYKRIDPYEVRELVIEASLVSTNTTEWNYLGDAVRPFRWMMDCRCESIRQDLKDDAAIAKASPQAQYGQGKEVRQVG